MRIRDLLPASLMLAVLAGCSSGATQTATAEETSVGMDAKAGCHADKACTDKAAKDCAGKTQCEKPAAAPKTNE